MSYSTEVLADSPLGYWRLGETSGTTLNDSSGNARHGNYFGAPYLGRASLLASDPADSSVNFPGAAASHARVPDGSWMNVSTSLTLECWVRGTVASISNIVDRDLSGQRCWQFRATGQGRFEFIATGGTGGTVGSLTPATATINDGDPHHLAATYDGASIRLYFDGSLVTTTARAGNLPSASTSPLVIGATYGGTGNPTSPFPGRIDEVAMYDTVLSDSRLAAHYAAGIATSGGGGGPSGELGWGLVA